MRLRKYRRWGRQAIIDAFQFFYFWYGRSPTTFDLENVLGLPNETTVWREFGSLADAREAAGMEPGLRGRGGRGRGGGPKYSTPMAPEQREAKRLYLEEWRRRMQEEMV